MSSESAAIDNNGKPSLIAVSSSNGSDIVRLYADPTTHRLLVTATGGSTAGFQRPTGTVNGSNAAFVFTLAPNVISVDGNTMQATASDGTVNWTGTTTITLSVAPNFDIFGVN